MSKVKFYSTEDLGNGWQLQKAESIIESFNDLKEYNIVDLLEFYNIIKYIDNKVFLKKWDDDYIRKVKEICIQMNKKVFKYFNNEISEKNISNIVKIIPIQYIEDFFELFGKVIKKINIKGSIFVQILSDNNIPIRYVLYFKQIVKEYDAELRGVMLKDMIQSAKIIIRKYFINENNNKRIEIPKSLSMEEKERILIKYIESENPNLDYLKIIARIQNNKDLLEISDKTKLKAQRKIAELENKLFKDGTSIEYCYYLKFDDKQKTIKKEKIVGTKITYSYSKKWIEENKDDFATLLNNFIYLFDFTD